MLVNPLGNVFTIDATTTLTANPDGTTHVRVFGENTFGFEDMNAATAGVDFDYNDMIVKLSPCEGGATPLILRMRELVILSAAKDLVPVASGDEVLRQRRM